MMIDLIAHIATCNGLGDTQAKRALGIVLNGAERQSSPLAAFLFKKVPGARVLAARTGDEIGAPTGEIARLIEQTPGGRRRVTQSMISALHDAGLGHEQVGGLLPSIGSWVQSVYGVNDFGHLGDLMSHTGSPARGEEVRAA